LTSRKVWSAARATRLFPSMKIWPSAMPCAKAQLGG
jgi:hypothetical protein